MLVNLQALQEIRIAELQMILPHLPLHGRILEIGGGSGWQAAYLAALGYEVESVDLDSNPYVDARKWPVRTYDGRSLPFPDNSFDFVFSSNVLEHVDDLIVLLRETSRVVKAGGTAIHLMPTPLWRVLTFIAHYPWLLRTTIQLWFGHLSLSGKRVSALERSPWWLLRRIIAAPRHGEHGTALGELWTFRRRAWLSKLSQCTWQVESDCGVGIVYSGYFICHPWLGLGARRHLAKCIGSSCRAYRLRRIPDSP